MTTERGNKTISSSILQLADSGNCAFKTAVLRIPITAISPLSNSQISGQPFAPALPVGSAFIPKRLLTSY